MHRGGFNLGLLLALLVFTDTFGYAIVLPLIPLAASRRGAGPLAVGAIFATYSFLQLVLAPWLGRLSDRWGRRPVLLGSLAGSAVGFALMLLPGYPALLISRVIDGGTAGNISVANAVVLDRFRREEWGGRFTLLASATGLGIVGGVGVSALLARFGLSAAAVAALILSLASALVLWRFLPETSPRARSASRFPVPRFHVQLAIPSGLFATTLQAAFLLTLPLFFFRLLGWRETQSTLAIAVLIGVAAVVQIAVVAPLMRSAGPRVAALAGFVLMGASGVLLATAVAVPLVLVGAGAGAVGLALLAPAVPTLIGMQNHALAEGEVMGVNQSVASAGQMAGPLLGYGALFLATSGYGVVCTALAAGGLILTLPIRARS